jgi:hypothetical protein
MGWVQVEVTGGGPGEGGEGGESGGNGEMGGDFEDSVMDRIVIKPAYQFKKYDGTPLLAQNEIQSDYILEKLLAEGYTFDVRIEGSQTDVGTGKSVVVDFVLWDPYHNDVTDQFIIEYCDGVLSVSQNIIKIYIYQKNYEYRASEYCYDRNDYVVIEIEDGLVLEILDINISREEVGFVTASEINENIEQYIRYAVYAEGSMVDISQNYHLVVVNYGAESDYNVMSIKPKHLVITTGSAKQEYNGKELTDDSFYISTGSVAAGHKINLSVIGSIIEQGVASNMVNKSSFSIIDKNGKNVTLNYEVDFVLGTLEII